MKKKITALFLTMAMVLSLTACGEPTERTKEEKEKASTSDENKEEKSQETTAPFEEKEAETAAETTVGDDEEPFAKWNGTFIAKNGDKLTLHVYESSEVESKYIYAGGGSENFGEGEAAINENDISVVIDYNDFCVGVDYVLNGDTLHLTAWNLESGETEKYIFIDINMYRDGKMPGGAELTEAEVTTRATVRAEELQYVYKVVRDDSPEDYDYYTAGEFMVVEYDKYGGISIQAVFVNHSQNTYASYSSESEIGTYTWITTFSGDGDVMQSEPLGQAKFEFSGEYAYVTFEGNDTATTLIRVE